MSKRRQLHDERELLARPGDTITETLEHLKMSQAQLAVRMGKTPSKINDIISGKEPITYNTALQLERVLGVDASFWLNLEMAYRERLARLEQQEQLQQYLDWIKEHPVRELAREGYIDPGKSEEALVEALLKFYGVVSPMQWSELYVNDFFKASFLKNKPARCEVSHLTSWFRVGELEMQKQQLPAYNKGAFREALTLIRHWVVDHPEPVLGRVKDLCASAGVSVVFHSVGRVPAKGAARWVGGNPLIQVAAGSARKREDFWFTFYHEVAHVLLHGRKEVFVDHFEGYRENRQKEAEADEFAHKQLEQV